MGSPGLASVRVAYDAILENRENPVTQEIDYLDPVLNNLPSECQADLMRYVNESIKLSCSEINKKYPNTHRGALIREVQLQVLFILECRKFCLLANPELELDDRISDWISEHLGRLSLCIPDRATWKTFLHNCIIERYGKVFGRILYNVCLNLGVEPPDCLPRGDSDTTGTPSREDVLSDGDATGISNSQHEQPRVADSAPNTRSQLRQSLPRALFADPAIVAAAAATVETVSKSATSKDIQRCQPVTSTPNVGSDSPCEDKIPPASQSSGGPKLVLISCARSRRKCRTPTKRTPINRSSRRNKNSQTPPIDKSLLTSIGKKRATRNQQSKQSNCSTSRSFTGRHSKSSSKRRQSDRDIYTQPAELRSVKTPERRYRRSVHETPNPERSYPRWERARLAAAEKTKDRAIVVEESPIKPVGPLGSPLRRLRRANSMLASLCYAEPKEPDLIATTCCTSINRLSQDSGAPHPVSITAAGCLSVGMSRAERWRRRQFEEESSLSQFAEPPTQFDLKSPSLRQQPMPESDVTKLTPNSGLLCNPGALRRRSSNLFANMTSPEQQNGRKKTPRKNIFCKSPPLKSPKRSLPAPSVSPPLQIFPNGNRIHSPLLYPVPKSPVTTPTAQRRLPNTRTRPQHLSDNAAAMPVRVVPISPQVFDEEAMFLGREEFLSETNTTPSVSICSPLRTFSNESDGAWESDVASSARKRKRYSPLPPSMNPPIMRLSSLPKIIESVEPVRAGRNSGPISTFLRTDSLKRSMRRRPQTTATTTTPKKSSESDAGQLFPFLAKPIRSPFAPLHVFTRPAVCADVEQTGIPGELLECTTTMSSQSASTVFALRTRLFGNSNSNEPDSNELENRHFLSTISSGPAQPIQCSVGPSPENSRHLWDENSLDIKFSPGLRNLNQTEQENVVLNLPAISNKSQPSANTSVSRHRRSLFS
ncbi:hypothetical protein CRM22_010578 [Opisthorchis felineus]|uniref:Uncharacterized protein n=1 Tax=Opisthorchis felineus TaxID=147828 RepID=A0A4S2KXF6_OPIFE|nr:hypothetical protein CRM22_010578 [Opisthorchis felineus]